MTILYVGNRNGLINAHDADTLAYIEQVAIDDPSFSFNWARGLSNINGIIYAATFRDYLQRYTTSPLAFVDGFNDPAIGTYYGVTTDGTSLWIITDTFGIVKYTLPDLSTLVDSGGSTGYRINNQGNFLFTSNIADYSSIHKYAKTDLNTSLASFTTVNGGQVVDIAVNSSYVFVISNRGIDYTVYKLNIADLSLVSSEASGIVSGGSYSPFAGIACDETYIYIIVVPNESPTGTLAKALISSLTNVSSVSVSNQDKYLTISAAAPVADVLQTLGQIIW